MTNPLDEACLLLDDFEKEITALKDIRDQIAMDNPNFEQLAPEYWTEEYYRIWLHGATDLWERRELERWLTDYPAITATANASAKKIHDAWRDWLAIAGPVKVQKVLDYDKKKRGYVERETREQSEAFYADDGRFEILEPQQEETLYDFIVRLYRWLRKNMMIGKNAFEKSAIGRLVRRAGFKKFFGLCKKTLPTEQVAFIEHIFPQKMDLHFGRIMRLIPLEAYPIPERLRRKY